MSVQGHINEDNDRNNTKSVNQGCTIILVTWLRFTEIYDFYDGVKQWAFLYFT